MTLGGTVIVRNGIALDFCFEMAIRSLLPICDQVVVSDSDSTDGTSTVLESLASIHPKIKLVNWRWPSPHNAGGEWLVEWINFARSHLKTDMHFALDADEVLHENSYDEILEATRNGKALWVKRLNFWLDPQHLIPEGHVCGSRVVRLGPQNLLMPSDAPYPNGEPEIRRIAVDSGVIVGHYGFLRKDAAFKAKCKVMTQAYFGVTDPRIIEAEEKNVPWNTITTFPVPLQEWKGQHPMLIVPWLENRGYKV